jgi:hypothetical protein
MNFEEKLQEFTHSLATTKEYQNDVALQRVVEILKATKTERELKKNVSLINRISIDSVENWDTINKIGAFLKPYS